MLFEKHNGRLTSILPAIVWKICRVGHSALVRWDLGEKKSKFCRWMACCNFCKWVQSL